MKPKIVISSDKKIHEKDKSENITIATVGDIIVTNNANLTASKNLDYKIKDPYKRIAKSFESLFSQEIKDFFYSSDLVFGNLENPLAEGLTKKWYYGEDGRPVCEKVDIEPGILHDDKVYYLDLIMLNINANPAFASTLKNLGFDIVSTANNHYTNRAANGIDSTIESCRKANLDCVGTIHYKELEYEDGYPANVPYIIKTIKGIKIAFLGFNSPINHIARNNQFFPFIGYQIYPVLIGKLPRVDRICSRQAYTIVSDNKPVEFNVRRFCEWIKRAKIEADLVFVSTHFGIYRMFEPSILQKKLSHRFLDAGADVIIGHGPHVIQPIEKYLTKDGRETFIINSLGNFLCLSRSENSHSSDTFVGMIVFTNIQKCENGSAHVKNISYVPTYINEDKENILQTIIPDLSRDAEAKIICKTVFEGFTSDRKKLTSHYMHWYYGDNFFSKDDTWWEEWILKKWAKGK